MTDYIITDRYDALGISHPNAETVCEGDCEGMGFFPVFKERGVEGNQSARPSKDTEGYDTEWDTAEAVSPATDGYHFIKCPSCNGTGRRK